MSREKIEVALLGDCLLGLVRGIGGAVGGLVQVVADPKVCCHRWVVTCTCSATSKGYVCNNKLVCMEESKSQEHALPLHQIFSAPCDAIFMKFWVLMEKVHDLMSNEFHKDHSMYARTACKTTPKIARWPGDPTHLPLLTPVSVDPQEIYIHENMWENMGPNRGIYRLLAKTCLLSPILRNVKLLIVGHCRIYPRLRTRSKQMRSPDPSTRGLWSYLPNFKSLEPPHGLEEVPVVHRLGHGHHGEVGQLCHWLSYCQY